MNKQKLFALLLALILLLERFERYIGENGIIEYPPDYMFVDWLAPDGISMHHPPKALGQTCLNMFYVTCPMVLTYDVFVLSIGGIIYESVAMISALIGIIRNSKASKEKQS